MTNLYCKLIVAKRRTIADVPSDFKKEVELRLKELGYGINGDPLNDKE